MKGRIIKTTGSWQWVQLDNETIVKCRTRGKLRMEGLSTTNPVAVGDYVELEFDENHSKGSIKIILQRNNYIVRKSPKQGKQRHVLAANIDLAVLISTLKYPTVKYGFIDRFLTSCQLFHIPVLIVVNKEDLINDELNDEWKFFQSTYQAIGYPLLRISALKKTGLEALKKYLKNKTCLITGNSGVGKSLLINRLIPDLNLKTASLSKFTGKGKHTTTFTQMYPLPEGGFLIDTPGIKEWKLSDVKPRELAHYFPEFIRIMKDCKFQDCQHVKEPGCAVRIAVENAEISPFRYEQYLNIYRELKAVNYWELDD